MIDNENFKALVQKRAKMIWPLSIFLVLALAGNLFLMSSGADIGARKISEDGVITIALVYSIVLIFIGALIAGFYVRWANKNLDPLMDIIVQEADVTAGQK